MAKSKQRLSECCNETLYCDDEAYRCSMCDEVHHFNHYDEEEDDDEDDEDEEE